MQNSIKQDCMSDPIKLKPAMKKLHHFTVHTI